MKKIFTILFLSFLWCETSNAEDELSELPGCIDGNCVNGEGTFIWKNGDKYFGGWKDSKPHGTGTFEWIDGTKYSGEWESGSENGRGTVTWPNGDKYIGGRKNNQADGFGLYIYANGYKMSGVWKKGELVKEVSLKKGKLLEYQNKPIGKVIWQKEFKDNNNQCKLLKKDPGKIYIRNLNWKSEVENIKKKRFVYLNQKNLTYRNIKDLSALKEIKFIKVTSGKKLDGFKGVPRNRKTNKIKSFPIKFDAYIYHVTYGNCDHHIEFRINKKFKRDKADKLVKKYSLMFGQLPFFLRHGYKLTKTMTEHYRVHRITIHPGSGESSFATIERLDEPRDPYAYHLGEDPFGDQGHAFTLYPEGNPEIFYTLLHEAAHASIQQYLVNSRKWFQAVKDDKIYITDYARTNFAEDIAETIAFWVGIRCYEDRIKRKTKEKVLKKIPNRIRVLDELNLNTYPVVCK